MLVQGDRRAHRLVSLQSPSHIHNEKTITHPLSALVGPKDFIKRAKWFRKAFGGGIRQAGFMTVSADYALTHHFPRLASTHALARRLADGLQGLGCEILAPVDTNMVRIDTLTLPF